MKTLSRVCLLILLACTNTASQAQPSRRHSPRSTPFDASKFIGVWEYTDDPLQKKYFNVTERTAQSFKFNEGWEWQGQISWPETMVNGTDGIYLAPVNGKLRGTFVSPNFRATHGYDITYTITLTPQPNGRLVYSITSELAPEKHYATRVGDGPSPGNSNQWTELNLRQKKGAFQFSLSRTLLHNGRPISGVRFRPTVRKIAISPPEVGGKYRICVTFDDIDSVAFLLRLDNHSGKQLALQGPPSVWATWSPSGTHAIIGSYYEADQSLYSINLLSGVAHKFSFNVATQTEEEIYDLDNLTWNDNRIFRLRLTVNCNPYADNSCSDQDRKKVLREYEIRADVVTLAIFSKRIR